MGRGAVPAESGSGIRVEGFEFGGVVARFWHAFLEAMGCTGRKVGTTRRRARQAVAAETTRKRSTTGVHALVVEITTGWTFEFVG